MGEIKKRITEKIIEVQERKFVIEKLDAQTGGFIAFTLLSRSVPSMISGAMGVALPQTGTTMSKKEWVELQKDILSCVSEKLPVGKTQIYNEQGNFAVLDMEKNAALLMRLTIDAVQFNFMDFFDANLWSGLLPPELGLILSQLLTSTNFFSLLSRGGTGGSTNCGTEPTT